MNIDFEFKDLVKLLRENKKTSGYEIDVTTNLVSDLGFDSIDLMQMIINIESRFGITFSIEDLDMKNVIRVNELFSFIQARIR